MKAVVLRELGPAGNLEVGEMPIPEPADDEILVKVEVAGAIHADTMMRRGDYPLVPPLPFVPGREVAGTVERVGANVNCLDPGARVTADMPNGGYAEYAVAKASTAIPIPDHVTFEQAVVHHFNLPVAYLAYYVFGEIQPDETILVHSAAGGIGSLFVQIAKRRANNVVIGLVSTEDKVEKCLANGADHAINTKSVDYVSEVQRITDGRGVDVSFNNVAGPTLRTDPQVIRTRGRWLISSWAGGKEPLDLTGIMLKSFTLRPFSLYSVWAGPEFQLATAFLREWLTTEQLDTPGRTFAFEDAAAAHTWMEERQSFGKVALVP